MVSMPFADLGSVFVPNDARDTDTRWSDPHTAEAHAPATGDQAQSPATRRWFTTGLQTVLERIVERTHAATGADTCVLFRITPATRTLRTSIVAGRAPESAVEPISINPLPDARPLRIELADSHLFGWLSSIPGFGALRVGWNHTSADCEPGVVELAARLAEAAIDQGRTGSLNLADWKFADSVLGANAMPVFARDATGRLFHVNQPVRDLLGIDASEVREPIQERAFIRSLDLRDQFGRKIDPSMLPSARLRTGRTAPDIIVSARNPRGGRQWLLLHGETIRNGDGRIAVVLTTLQDFTVMQRHGESQWLRARVTAHLHQRPLDLASIEHDIAAYLDGTCTIQVAVEPARNHAKPASGGPRITIWREASDGAAELREAHGHLHLPAPAAVSDRERPIGARMTHTVDIPMRGDGEIHAHLICTRAAHRAEFREDEIELLTELAEQIGLALAVSRLRESLLAGERELIDIGQRLQHAEETERRRMALSIHDGLAQVAASVCQQLEILADRFEPASDAELRELERARDLARLTVREARELISGLRPVTLDNLGLGAAVGEVIETLRRDGWTIHYVNCLGDTRLDADIELDLYRVVQEAITNARKYAQTSRIDISLEQRGTTVRFEVRDQGTGFDPIAAERAGTSGSHVGLGGMRERIARLGGTILIDSAPSHGTRIVGEVPIQRTGLR